jgi:hypothetical protein
MVSVKATIYPLQCLFSIPNAGAEFSFFVMLHRKFHKRTPAFCCQDLIFGGRVIA